MKKVKGFTAGEILRWFLLTMICIFLISIAALATVCWAGDKEEAELKVQLLQEKFMRIHLTIEVLNNRLTEAQNIPATIKALEKQREEIRLELDKLTAITKPPVGLPPQKEGPKPKEVPKK